ncbi:MAG: S9 family peptidase [Acidimicrobiaceae bacterium]|nr:S9 family peptidase [Acidimicrobiaceae bacterium]MYG54095.1 S9 family peptidase [Acidimicrobiaceae bacterium]MYK00163.1 S9 family peptidase [Acidimicrobiaceae bacterium]
MTWAKAWAASSTFSTADRVSTRVDQSTERRVTPYGAWSSSISAADLVGGAVRISEVRADPVDPDLIWWSENRPEEGGRTAVVRYSIREQSATENTPIDANVRTLVHEYGGGAWWPHNGELFYVDFADQRLRLINQHRRVRFLTDEPARPRADRFADGRVTPDGRWCVLVREQHRVDAEPTNEVVAVATDGSAEINVLYSDADFVMSPRLSPAGDLLAWISWDHPNMSWDSTRLHVAPFADGRISGELLTVGQFDEASYCEPDFGTGGLRVCSDHEGWWNLYDLDLSAGVLSRAVGGPFEIATPPWVFGMQRWAARPTGSGDEQVLAVAGLPTGDELIVDGSTVSLIDSSINSLSAGPGAVVAVGSGYGHETEVISFNVDANGLRREVVRPSRSLPFEQGYLVEPEWITFPTGPGDGDGGDGGRSVAHGLYYPPTNPRHVGPDDERPPLMVLAHGGPTAQARRELQPGILYWTSRGIAVVDVDYRGSTGYGTAFRKSLNGLWGVADVVDCVAAAQYLAERGDVDPERLMIRGGSAGGFTVLAALAFHNVFSAGANRYGIADLEALATDTHKFESRYLDTLVGPYPEQKATYIERSPINHVDGIDVPLIVLQGAEDVIVPPSQSEMIVSALKSKGVKVAYLLFPDEQHGFRQADNIVRALEAELAFFGDVLGFSPAGLTTGAGSNE